MGAIRNDCAPSMSANVAQPSAAARSGVSRSKPAASVATIKAANGRSGVWSYGTTHGIARQKTATIAGAFQSVFPASSSAAGMAAAR